MASSSHEKGRLYLHQNYYNIMTISISKAIQVIQGNPSNSPKKTWLSINKYQSLTDHYTLVVTQDIRTRLIESMYNVRERINPFGENLCSIKYKPLCYKMNDSSSADVCVCVYCVLDWLQLTYSSGNGWNVLWLLNKNNTFSCLDVISLKEHEKKNIAISFNTPIVHE